MSKKMSMQDMKEVRRIVSTLLADSVEMIPVINSHTYHSKTTFMVNFGYYGFKKSSEALVKKDPAMKELSDLQLQLVQKRKLALKNLINATVSEIKKADEDEAPSAQRDESTKLRDDYSVIEGIRASVERTIEKHCKTIAEEVTRAYNDYVSKIESRTFDAYTKGMSADDFLGIIREEVKALEKRASSLTKELIRHEYSTDRN